MLGAQEKALQLKAKGLEIDELPLLESFRTFKGNIIIENIRLNQLILQY
jgi:hypothetical protein